jgi:O-antigen/teichoic acid export membrane protein
MNKLHPLIKRIVSKLGVDKSIAYSSSARVIQAFTGVASIFFISRYLTGVEQGFYFTFGSIVALQVFFELGLNGIITQYVAHEASHLTWHNSYTLEGESQYKSRLASLFRFSIKWFTVVSFVVFVILVIAGFLFFSFYQEDSDNVSWKIPWLLISSGTVINLFLAPILAILMGLDKVKEVSKIRFYQQIILPLAAWLGLFLGFKLYVVGVSSLLSGLLVVIYIFSTDFKKIIRNIWNISITEKVSYLKEIFPYQWKIALSWISGYFIFQLFNPVLFATEGPIVAGQMGMTLAALNGIQAFSMSWLNTKVPLYSKLIALKNYYQLDSVFNKTVKQMSFVCFGLLLTMLVSVFIIRQTGIKLGDNYLGERFLDYIPIILLMIPIFINQFVFSWATNLRCHKQEPFLIISIVCGIACCLSTILLGKYYGVLGVTGGYCLLTLGFMPWGYWIYKAKKIEWHNQH